MPKKDSDVNKVTEGYYTIHASDFSFLCNSALREPADGSRIILDAQGGGMKTMDGHVLLCGTGSTLMLCDSSSVGIRNTSSGQQVHVESDKDGKITIHQGDEVNSPMIVLDSKGITLSVGFNPDLEGCQIKMTMDGITLQCGPAATGSQIKMTPNGITLQCGPNSQQTITPQSIKLAQNVTESLELGSAKAALKGMAVDVAGSLELNLSSEAMAAVKSDGMLTLKGTMTMIN